MQAEIAPSSGHAEHPVCARGDVEKGVFLQAEKTMPYLDAVN